MQCYEVMVCGTFWLLFLLSCAIDGAWVALGSALLVTSFMDTTFHRALLCLLHER